MLDGEWQNAEKKIDPDFVGSIFEKMGWDAELCPTCNAHLHGGVCLNVCHLSRVSRKRFGKLMGVVVDRRRAERKQHEA